ncbi:MAG: DNA-protecting protein DprA [Mycoplasmataceae bacterium]|nr:DNA-protecting protein DprA [Mycoplasmataceae bacterium]MBR3259678.1 DNA-protecting protein DprA [Mycoplasmataceae bacterium]MBR3348116.1 DNA-protecting protein DprA [Mycoplasmataceae bacterium]MBR3571138.1 DNA-protecting protein DprA [Mycoplasmataceae bacterium]MBR3832522.1 DNA-protecting protein DprA [Mycoplasmataceae bacterium]
MNLILIYFSIKYKGYFYEIYNALKRREFVPIEELEEIERQLNNKELNAITIIDEDYPEELKQINKPPFVLFYKGNKKLLLENKLLLTGDFSNPYIENFLNDSIDEIYKKHILISNLSKGLDENIINYIIDQKKKIILISSNGLENPYFAKDIENLPFIKDNFLLLSEYPNNVNINKRRLIERNRISIGLSKALIIASSNKESRILSLVSFALDQGKEIFCYPGIQTKEDGNNILIQDGATMITSIKDKIY